MNVEMSVRSKLSRQLSIIQEAHAGHDRLVYVVIGPGARVVASFVARSAATIFPNLAADPSFMSDKRGSARNSEKKPSRRSDGMGTGPMGSSAGDAFAGEECVCQFYLDGYREIEEKRCKDKAKLQKKKAEKDAAKLAEELNRNDDNEDSNQKKTVGSRISSFFHSSDQTGRRSSARASTVSRKSGARFSLLSRASVATDVTEVPRKVVKTSYVPVETFSQEVPACPSAAHFKDVCILFLIDERQEVENDLLSDLTFRKAEVERWIQVTTKKFNLSRYPPLLAAMLVHSSTCGISKPGWEKIKGSAENGLGAKPGAIVEVVPAMPGSCAKSDGLGMTVQAVEDLIDPTASQKTSASQTSPASEDSGARHKVLFSPPEDWKYKTFLEAIRSLVKVQDMAYTCDFDDQEALLECMCKLSAEILKRRSTEEGMEMTTDPQDGLLNDKKAKKGCCNKKCCVVS